MKAIPKISKYMTTNPHSIGVEQTVAKADELMREHRIRHLPVMKNGKLCGVLSDRDVKLYMGLKGSQPKTETVQALATEDVYAVTPDVELDDVLATMAEKKMGSVVVLDNNKLVGIFTAIDGLRAASELLNTRLKK